MIHAAQVDCLFQMGYHVFAKCVYGLGLSVIFLSNLGSATVLKNVRSKDVANIHRCSFYYGLYNGEKNTGSRRILRICK